MSDLVITRGMLRIVLVVLAFAAGLGQSVKLSWSSEGEAQPAIPAGFPDASTAGVPDGTALTDYTGPMTITQDGTVIENKIINGALRITGDNVVIKNCKINFNGWWGVDAEEGANVTIQDCDIVGPGYGGDSNSAILGSGIFLRNDISHVENGLTLGAGASTVVGNYIHDLQDSAPEPHYDGIAAQGGQHGVLIENNTVISRDTSNIIVSNDFGAVSDVMVRNNYLAGSSGWNIYVCGDKGGATDVTITGNYIEKGGYGYYYIVDSQAVISENIEVLPGTTPQPSGRPQSAL